MMVAGGGKHVTLEDGGDNLIGFSETSDTKGGKNGKEHTKKEL